MVSEGDDVNDEKLNKMLLVISIEVNSQPITPIPLLLIYCSVFIPACQVHSIISTKSV